MPRPTLATAEIELDLGRYELRRSGRRVKLEKKPMELLIFLVARRDQLVSREDIVTRLWRSDLFVDTERNINNIVRKIRTALGDRSTKPRFLETVIGKGYRFIGPVRVIDARQPSTAPAQHHVDPSTSTSWNERSSLAILPLLLLGNATDERGLSLGFADALISRLGNLQGIDVLPTSAVLSAPTDSSPAEIAARLGVRFVVRGAIQSTKGQLRLSIEMFDTRLQATCFSRKSDLEIDRLFELQDDLARALAASLHRHLTPQLPAGPSRYSKDRLAYAEFMRGYRLSSTGNLSQVEEAIRHLSEAVTRDPAFSLAHATLSWACATRHFELDPARTWLERAEFHCRRALELDPNLPEAHVANAFLLWGPSKNFQHLEAIQELRRAIALQQNLPHAYNRLGTILAHIGLFDHARAMYERGRAFHPRKELSHSILQLYIWNREDDSARAEIARWREQEPGNRYPLFFAPQLAILQGDWKSAKDLLKQAALILPDEPLIVSLQGVFHALTGKSDAALKCLAQACANPKSFGHAHHTYYQVACILSILGQRDAAFGWLERSVTTGFACWPLFLKDPWLDNLRTLPDFDFLVSSLQSKYPDNLGLL